MTEFTFQVTFANNGAAKYLHEKVKVMADNEPEAFRKLLDQLTRSDIRSISLIDIY